MKTKARSFRLSEDANEIIEELTATFGLTRTAVIELAIRIFYDQADTLILGRRSLDPES